MEIGGNTMTVREITAADLQRLMAEFGSAKLGCWICNDKCEMKLRDPGEETAAEMIARSLTEHGLKYFHVEGFACPTCRSKPLEGCRVR